MAAVAGAGLVGAVLLVALAAWVDRHREAVGAARS
jgi:hypothetical protein